MAIIEIDARGAVCPVPTLKMTSALAKQQVKPGDTLAVIADCPKFEKDVREWCQNMRKVLIVIKPVHGNALRAEIRV